MSRWSFLWMLLMAGSLIAFGCAGEYNTDDDDDTIADDDDDDNGDDDDNDDDDDDNVDDDDDDNDDDDNDDDDDNTGTYCNDFDPIDAVGASWTYNSSYTFMMQDGLQGDYGTEVVSSQGSTYHEGNAVYRRIGTFTGAQYTVNWTGYNQCEAGGNHDYGSSVIEAQGQLSVTTYNTPAVMYLPFNPGAGDNWSAAYTQQVDMGDGNGYAPFNVSWQFSVVGMQSVSVPAGQFNCVHVQANYTSADPIGNHTGTLDTYWAEGVGLVKWDEQRPGAEGQYILRELVSYNGL